MKLIEIFEYFGFLKALIYNIFKTKPNIDELQEQTTLYGYNSLFIIAIVSIFIGVIQSLQLYEGFHLFNAEGFIGYTVFISMVKELSPVLGGLILIGKNISKTTAEISSMQISKQFHMMDLLKINKYQLIFIPRFLGMLFTFPILIIFFTFLSILSAYFTSLVFLDVNNGDFYYYIEHWIKTKDILEGIFKITITTFFIGSLSLFLGTKVGSDSKSLGEQTTKAVVVCSITLFLIDYIVSTIFFNI